MLDLLTTLQQQPIFKDKVLYIAYIYPSFADPNWVTSLRNFILIGRFMPSNALLAHSQAKLFIADLAEGAQIERIQVRSIQSDAWEGVFWFQRVGVKDYHST